MSEDQKVIAALLQNISFHADKAKYWVEHGFERYAEKEMEIMTHDYQCLIQRTEGS